MKKRKKYYYHQQIRINADVCAVNYFSEASRRVKPNVQTLKRKKKATLVGAIVCMVDVRL